MTPFRVVDVVERLHDVRSGQVPLEDFAIGEFLRFEFRDGAVTRGKVVAGVDDRLVDEGLRGNRVAAQTPREHLKGVIREAATDRAENDLTSLYSK